MSNYQSKCNYTQNKFQLELYPYAAAPENRFASGAALQYGADFKLSFTRAGTQSKKLGLIQLIFPQTQVGANSKPNEWNVDKGAPDMTQTIVLARALYGSDTVKIGAHSAYYKDQIMRSTGVNTCYLIDTPREIVAGFDSNGNLTKSTTTKFANYVVEMDGSFGSVFNEGMIWSYGYVQDGAKFNASVTAPRAVMLKDTNEHLNVLANFLGVKKDELKAKII